MAGYGAEQFSPAATISQDEVIRLFVHYRNKNAYIVSRDGMVLRMADTLYARAPDHTDEMWTLIAEFLPGDQSNPDVILVDNEPRQDRWVGPARAGVIKEAEALCGKNAFEMVRHTNGTLVFTLPRAAKSTLTDDQINAVTGVIYNSGGTLRVVHASGNIVSYHQVRNARENVRSVVGEGWNADPAKSLTVELNLTFDVAMAESRYESQYNILPKPHTEYYHTDGQWRTHKQAPDIPDPDYYDYSPDDPIPYDDEDDDDDEETPATE